MQDRQPINPGRIKITLDDGTVLNGILERDDSPTVEGTPLNKASLFNEDNSLRYACDLPSEAFGLIGQDILVVLASAGWSADTNTAGYYEQTVSVSGMREVYTPLFAAEIGNAESLDALQEAFGNITRAITSDGAVTFYALEVPEIDVTVRLKGV